jgi:hypothetical protein
MGSRRSSVPQSMAWVLGFASDRAGGLLAGQMAIQGVGTGDGRGRRRAQGWAGWGGGGLGGGGGVGRFLRWTNAQRWGDWLVGGGQQSTTAISGGSQRNGIRTYHFSQIFECGAFCAAATLYLPPKAELLAGRGAGGVWQGGGATPPQCFFGFERVGEGLWGYQPGGRNGPIPPSSISRTRRKSKIDLEKNDSAPPLPRPRGGSFSFRFDFLRLRDTHVHTKWRPGQAVGQCERTKMQKARFFTSNYWMMRI